jgi:hypothetical protein
VHHKLIYIYIVIFFLIMAHSVAFFFNHICLQKNLIGCLLYVLILFSCMCYMVMNDSVFVVAGQVWFCVLFGQ